MNERMVRCMVCGRGFGKYSCIKCGNVVCEKCYDKESKICASCKRGDRA